MKPVLKYSEERRPRTTMYASDYGKLGIDINLSLKGVEPTNPYEWNSTLRMAAGKAIELQMLEVLKQNGIVDPGYDQEREEAVQIEREGVPIRMRFDARSKRSKMKVTDPLMPNTEEIEIGEGEPIEIKSINNKNSFDIQRYIDGKPRESYVGQLAIYMDALGKEQGHLFVASGDGLNYFWFVCRRVGGRVYRCGETEVDLDREYARFKRIWDSRSEEPDWNEVRYKKPIEEIDWTKLSASKISDARNGRAVVGDEDSWQVLYSPYKDLIVERQGVGLGYSDEELARIRELTAGYSSKKKQ